MILVGRAAGCVHVRGIKNDAIQHAVGVGKLSAVDAGLEVRRTQIVLLF